MELDLLGAQFLRGTGFTVQVLSHTPTWVFVVFCALLLFGYLQTKNRAVPKHRLLLQPLVLIALSLFGVVSAFSAHLAVGLLSWAAGIALAIILNRIFRSPIAGLRYSSVTSVVDVPGSWLPLGLWMGIFFTKYAANVALTRDSLLSDAALFVIVVSLIYGLLSGAFALRILHVLKHSAGERSHA